MPQIFSGITIDLSPKYRPPRIIINTKTLLKIFKTVSSNCVLVFFANLMKTPLSIAFKMRAMTIENRKIPAEIT
jgi:hypothetical protein